MTARATHASKGDFMQQYGEDAFSCWNALGLSKSGRLWLLDSCLSATACSREPADRRWDLARYGACATSARPDRPRPH